MFQLKHLVVILVCIVFHSASATSEVSLDTEISDLPLDDHNHITNGSETHSSEDSNIRQPSASDIVDHHDESVQDTSSSSSSSPNEIPPTVVDSVSSDHVQQIMLESLEEVVESQGNHDDSFLQQNMESNQENIIVPEEKNDSTAHIQEVEINTDDVESNNNDSNDPAQTVQPESEGGNNNKADDIETSVTESIKSLNMDKMMDDSSENSNESSDVTATLEQQNIHSAGDMSSTHDNLSDESNPMENDFSSEDLSTNEVTHSSEHAENDHNMDQEDSTTNQLEHATENLTSKDLKDVTTHSTFTEEENRQNLKESANHNPSIISGSTPSENSKNDIQYQPNCGVWGVYQPNSRYANISILALLFQDLFQKDEAEATAILKDLASSVVMPMEDIFARIQNVSEEISETVDSADRIAKSPNAEFVEGLDDIGKFFEGVDVPDELDVGAAGSSIQEVLMGQGTQIAIKRLKMGVVAVHNTIMAVKTSVVTNIEDIISRREELVIRKDEFLRKLQDGKTVFLEHIGEFRDSHNERRKELIYQLAQSTWRVTKKSTIAFQQFVVSLFDDGDDIDEVLKTSAGVDDEIQQMLRKVS